MAGGDDAPVHEDGHEQGKVRGEAMGRRWFLGRVQNRVLKKMGVGVSFTKRHIQTFLFHEQAFQDMLLHGLGPSKWASQITVITS